MKVLAVVALLAAPAAASPLGIAWTQQASCPSPGPNTLYPDQIHATADSVVYLEKQQLVRRSLATGALVGKSVTLPAGTELVGQTATALVAKDARGFAVHAAAAGERRWRLDVGRELLDASEPGFVGDDLAVVQRKRGTRTLQLLDGATGKPRWSRKLARAADRTAWTGGDARRVYLISVDGRSADYEVAAFDRKTGASQWTVKRTSLGVTKDHATPLVDGLVVRGSRELVVIDGSGKAHPFTLDRSPWVSAVDLANGRVYAQHGLELVAIDAALPKIAWRVAVADSHAKVVAASRDRIYVADADELRELSPADGTPRATFGIARTTIAPAGKRLIACTGTELRLLDAAAAEVPYEPVTLTGRVACADCGGDPLEVRFAGVSAMTDARGAFKLTVPRARGRYDLIVKFSEYSETAAKQITLTGAKTYVLGVLPVALPQEGG